MEKKVRRSKGTDFTFFIRLLRVIRGRISSHESQFHLHSRCWHDHLRSRQLPREGGPSPFHCWDIAMNQQDFLGREFFGVAHDRFSRRMRAKLKLLDVAPQRLSRFVRIERYELPGLRR